MDHTSHEPILPLDLLHHPRHSQSRNLRIQRRLRPRRQEDRLPLAQRQRLAAPNRPVRRRQTRQDPLHQQRHRARDIFRVRN